MKLTTKSQILFFVSFLLLASATSCESLPKKSIYADPHSQTLSKVIFSAATEKLDNVSAPEFSLSNDFRDSLSFSEIVIYESFYFSATIDLSLEPFFGESSTNKFEFLIATIGFIDSHKQLMFIEEEILVVRNEEFSYVFTNPDGIQFGHSFPDTYSLTFCTTHFLTPKSIMKITERDKNSYEFTVAKNETSVSLNIRTRLHETNYTKVVQTLFDVDAESYVKTDTDISIRFVETSFVQSGVATAAILEFNFDSMRLIVKSTTFSNLHTIRFSKALDTSGRLIDSSKAFTFSEVLFEYAQIYPDYNPSIFVTETVYLK